MFKPARALKWTATAGALVASIVINVSGASALSTSDRGAGILVWPKVVADPDGAFGVCASPIGKPCSVATQGTDCPGSTCLAKRTETLINIDNTTSGSAGTTKLAHCFLINANSHCENSPSTVCNQASQCAINGSSGRCVPGWVETDFNIYITEEQPVGWYASEGRNSFALEDTGTCSNLPSKSCSNDGQCPTGGTCQLGATNIGSLIPPVGELPFQGSIKCIEYDLQNPPVPDQSATRNSLIGHATIMTQSAADSPVDVAKYNAVGLQATGNSSSPTDTLQIGRSTSAQSGQADPTQEYSACPATLIVPHMFDGATDPNSVGGADQGVNEVVRTELTLVPCGDDFTQIDPGTVTAQFLVYNEFEQRFSASKKVDCFFEKQLSLIDTTNPNLSIWSAGVSGTLAGHTRVRGVGSENTGRGLLGVASLFARNMVETSSAYNISQQGDPKDGTQPDLIILP